MSINANFEFLDFFSQKMENTEEIHINVKYEDHIYQDKFPDSKGIFIQLQYYNEDIMLPITISRENIIIGKGKININQKQIFTKENLIMKWINIDQIDSKKGKSLNSIMKINVKISLTYDNFSEEISNSDTKNVLTTSKASLHNKNHSGYLKPAMMGSTMRSNNNFKSKNEFFQNSKLGLTPKYKANKPFGNNLSLNEKYKSCANNARNFQVKITGKSQVKPNNYTSTNFGNRSLHVGYNYNISYSESSGLLGSASTNNLGNDGRLSNKTKASTPSLLKNFSLNGNPKKNSISISKITRNSVPNMNPKNLNIFNSQTPNLKLKLDDDIDHHESKETSVKDSIYNDENNENLESPLSNFKKNCQKFVETYNEKFIENIPQDKFLLQNEANLLLEEMFKIQENYYSAYTDSIRNNIKLKELLVGYNTKYRLQLKKNHTLSHIQESLNIKNILSTTVNREEKSRLKDISHSIKNELGIMKKLKKIEFNPEENAKFLEENSVLKVKEEKRILITAMLNVYKNDELYQKIPTEKQRLIQNILVENGLIFDYPRVNNCLDNESKLKSESRSNFCEIDFTDTFKDKGSINNNMEEINKEIPILNESNHSEKSEIYNEDDDFDRKLNILLKKFNKKVNLRKISNGIYDYYGSQLRICIENDEFKVKIGASGLVDLMKFLDLTYKKNGFGSKNNGVSYKPPFSKSYVSLNQNDIKLKNGNRSTTPIRK